MSSPNRPRRKRFIFPMMFLITLAAFLLTGYGIALATQSPLLPSIYLPLIFRSAGSPVVETSTPTATATITLTPTSTPTPTITVEPGKVSIVDFAFQPAEITIHVGEKVEWENTGQMNHTATSDTGVWDSGVLAPDQKFSFTFDTVGDYPYHCTLHLNMTGIIHVVPNP